MAKIWDCFTFYNELDILEIRLSELDRVVDKFVLVEAEHTFRGNPKPLLFAENRHRFARWQDKIVHVVVRDMPLAAPSAWTRETHQRDCIMRGIGEAAAEDIVLVSDVDEIPRAKILERSLRDIDFKHSIACFCLDHFQHYLNWHVSGGLLGTRAVRRGYLKHPDGTRHAKLRSKPSPVIRAVANVKWTLGSIIDYGRPLRRVAVENAGWHFSFMGDAEFARNKIGSYSHAENDIAEVVGHGVVEERLRNRITVLGSKARIVGLDALPDAVAADPARFAALLDRDV